MNKSYLLLSLLDYAENAFRIREWALVLLSDNRTDRQE